MKGLRFAIWFVVFLWLYVIFLLLFQGYMPGHWTEGARDLAAEIRKLLGGS